ncbi:hypothetical protein [Desulfoplanes sp.]
MSNKKELSSTERLLDVIRGVKTGGSSQPSVPADVAEETGAVSVAPAHTDPGKIVVGISFDSTGIYLVAISGGKKNPHIVDYAMVEAELGDEVDLRTVVQRIVDKGYVGRFRLKKTTTWLMLRSEILDQWTVMVPRKVEGKDFAKAVYWAAKAKKKFDETSSVFDYYHIDECTEKGIEKLRSGVFTVPKKRVMTAKKVFADAGIALAGISTFSLCGGQLLARVPKGEEPSPIAVIRVDREWSRIDLFYHNVLAFSRRIKTGVESFAVSIQERSVTQVDIGPEDIQGGLEVDMGVDNSGMTLEEAFAILDAHGDGDKGSDPAPTDPAMSDESFMALVEPAVQRLVRQLERTFDHFRTTMKVPPLKGILFVGQIARFRTIIDYIGTQMDMKTGFLDPFDAPTLHSSLPVPSSIASRTVYGPACVAALADQDRTSNFLYNYRARARDLQLKKIHLGLGGVFLALLLGLGSFFVYNQQILAIKTAEYNRLSAELATYSGDVTDKGTRTLLGKLEKRVDFLRTYAKRFSSLAVFSEISRLTPDSVEINSLILNNGEEKNNGNLILDGIVVGSGIMLDSYLSNFIVMLDDSPIFADPTIQKQRKVKSGDEEQIRFVLSIAIN